MTDYTAQTWFASGTETFFAHLRAKCGRFDDEVIVYIAELLPVVALACERCEDWSGEIIVAVIDNDNAKACLNYT